MTDSVSPATRIEPMDFHVDWKPLAKEAGAGNGSASTLDVGALARLARHLPLDARTRLLLEKYAPHGRVSMATAKWTGNAEALQTFSALKPGNAA